jgi:hypothetical protein
MPWGDSPSTSAADAVRAIVGDTDAANPKLPDSVYTFILTQETSVWARAAMAAAMLAGKWAEEMTRRVGDLWREAKVVHDHYMKLAQWLRLESARRGGGLVFVGGVNAADAETRRDDTSQVQPNFSVGMLDSVEVTPEEDDDDA